MRGDGARVETSVPHNLSEPWYLHKWSWQPGPEKYDYVLWNTNMTTESRILLLLVPKICMSQVYSNWPQNGWSSECLQRAPEQPVFQNVDIKTNRRNLFQTDHSRKKREGWEDGSSEIKHLKGEASNKRQRNMPSYKCILDFIVTISKGWEEG